MGQGVGAADGLLRVVRSGRPGALGFAGAIDLATHSVLEQALAPAVDGDGDIHLDLADVDFIDVAGTRLLVTVAHGLAVPRRLVVDAPPYQLVRVLEIAGWESTPNLVVNKR